MLLALPSGLCPTRSLVIIASLMLSVNPPLPARLTRGGVHLPALLLLLWHWCGGELEVSFTCSIEIPLEGFFFLVLPEFSVQGLWHHIRG